MARMTVDEQTAPITSGVSENKKIILLVEDDPFLVGIYKEKLLIEGFEVIVAEDGLQGLSIATGKKVDLILLDIMIPKLSGIDLLARLKQDEKAKEIPVIALTNLSGASNEEKTRDYGVKEYLIKSDYTPSQVVDIIRKYIT